MSERSSSRAYSDLPAARVTARQVAMRGLRRKTGFGLGVVVITGNPNNGCADNELYPAGLEAIKDDKLVNGVGCTEPQVEAKIVKRKSHERGRG